jgi:NAD-dependent deacetylase
MEDILIGDKAEDGYQLRPDIVWFGEDVPLISLAMDEVATADVVVVVGTSLQVYPAAGLIHYALKAKLKYIIDPHCGEYSVPNDFIKIESRAVEGIKKILF